MTSRIKLRYQVEPPRGDVVEGTQYYKFPVELSLVRLACVAVVTADLMLFDLAAVVVGFVLADLDVPTWVAVVPKVMATDVLLVSLAVPVRVFDAEVTWVAFGTTVEDKPGAPLDEAAGRLTRAFGPATASVLAWYIFN